MATGGAGSSSETGIDEGEFAALVRQVIKNREVCGPCDTPIPGAAFHLLNVHKEGILFQLASCPSITRCTTF